MSGSLPPGVGGSRSSMVMRVTGEPRSLIRAGPSARQLTIEARPLTGHGRFVRRFSCRQWRRIIVASLGACTTMVLEAAVLFARRPARTPACVHCLALACRPAVAWAVRKAWSRRRRRHGGMTPPSPRMLRAGLARASRGHDSRSGWGAVRGPLVVLAFALSQDVVPAGIVAVTQATVDLADFQPCQPCPSALADGSSGPPLPR